MFKSEFWETCTMFNDCSECPLGQKDTRFEGENHYKCSANSRELEDDLD
jgi:hypothetical protein